MNWELSDAKPIWQQLHERLTQRIATGVYPKGSRMPAVRELAAEAGVNPNTMQRALAQLESDGLVLTNRTAGRTVTEDGVRLSELCMRLANEKIKQYLDSMALLGFSREEATALLEKWEENTQ
ncbi:MAG: GntR family transcriptional regulator [Oscillospiraceae bacterium]|nr:GntR family transcriptional regulator [Oscillospiraceae bacterium]